MIRGSTPRKTICYFMLNGKHQLFITPRLKTSSISRQYAGPEDKSKPEISGVTYMDTPWTILDCYWSIVVSILDNHCSYSTGHNATLRSSNEDSFKLRFCSIVYYQIEEFTQLTATLPIGAPDYRV